MSNNRAVARSENPWGHVVLGGDNVPPPPRGPPLATGLLYVHFGRNSLLAVVLQRYESVTAIKRIFEKFIHAKI